MFLRATKRFKDGKVHYYWSMVENVRVGRRVFRIARGEAEPPKAVDRGVRYGYSRDKRGDCLQVVVALVLTPDGFPARRLCRSRQNLRLLRQFSRNPVILHHAPIISKI